MRVTIRQKNLKITTALTRYIELKVLKPLRRRLKENISSGLPILDLEFSRTTRHHRKGRVFHAEANLSLGKKLIRAEADEEDIRTACDVLERELDHELRTFKGKKRAVEYRSMRRAKQELRYDPAARPRRGGRIRNEGN